MQTYSEFPADELVRLTLSGERDAYCELVRRYMNALFRLTLNLTGNYHTAFCTDIAPGKILHFVQDDITGRAVEKNTAVFLMILISIQSPLRSKTLLLTHK